MTSDLTSSIFSDLTKDWSDELVFDSYWDKVKYNCKLTRFNIWTESVRQWVIILCTIGFTLLFINSLINLRRTSQGMDLD
jgi:hypothetical protein